MAEAVEKLFGERLARNFLRTERQHAALYGGSSKTTRNAFLATLDAV